MNTERGKRVFHYRQGSLGLDAGRDQCALAYNCLHSFSWSSNGVYKIIFIDMLFRRKYSHYIPIIGGGLVV